MAILKGLFDIGDDLGESTKNLGDAWMEQHIYIIKKWLYKAVFATPIPPQIDQPKIRIFGICKPKNFGL